MTMRCVELRPILSLFLEKETGPLETLHARQHLDGCPPCRARAERIAAVMGACAALPVQEPPADIASVVMGRLRQLRRASGSGAAVARSGKWSGLALLVVGALTSLASPAAPVLLALRKPLDFLASLFNGDGRPARDLAESAAPLALRLLGGDLRADLSGAAGADSMVILQVVATALALCFTLAIPVAALTAWLLRNGQAARNLRIF